MRASDEEDEDADDAVDETVETVDTDDTTDTPVIVGAKRPTGIDLDGEIP